MEREKNSSQGVVGFDWGNPEAPDDYYGNYRQVLDWLKAAISNDSHVVEIGSYGGKWTQYMGAANKIICVDLFEESFDFLRERLDSRLPLSFYKTRGDELLGIPTQSVDLVFSMDSFVRIPKQSIQKYFREMYRVLKEGGKVLVHLPCVDIHFCRRKTFTPISKGWICEKIEEAGFKEYQLNFDLLKHGVLLNASK